MAKSEVEFPVVDFPAASAESVDRAMSFDEDEEELSVDEELYLQSSASRYSSQARGLIKGVSLAVVASLALFVGYRGYVLLTQGVSAENFSQLGSSALGQQVAVSKVDWHVYPVPELVEGYCSVIMRC